MLARLVARGSAVGWLLLSMGAAGLAGQDATPERVALRGEVVDLSCYLARGARGPEHAACADACIARGTAAGFVSEDGAAYLLLPGRDTPSPAELVKGLAGTAIEIEAIPVERDGLAALRLLEVVRPGSDATP